MMPRDRTRLAPHQRIYLAVDTTDERDACRLVERVDAVVGGVKLGKEFFTANGPAGVRRIAALGLPVFLDLKFHDIPNTVAAAVRAARPLAPSILNVHALGGAAMMRAARAALSEPDIAHDYRQERPLLIAVTILTSLTEEDLRALGIVTSMPDTVRDLARLAQACGLDGVVCSAREITALRLACGEDFRLIVPGVRPAWAAGNDQKRVMTPAEAIRLGADYLVIGRPITAAPDPLAAARRIVEEVAVITDGEAENDHHGLG